MAKKPSGSNKKSKASTSRTPVAAIVAVLVLLVVVAMCIFWAHHKSAAATITPTPTPSATASPSASTTPSTAPTATPTPTPSPVAATGQCGNLTGSLDTTGGGTAGTIYRQVVLTNKGAQACTVFGFPGVSLINAAGAQLGQPATRDGAAGQAITLAPGQSAASPVGFPEAANFSPGACSATSTSLKVYPPNQTTPLTIPLAAQYCPGFSVQTLASH